MHRPRIDVSYVIRELGGVTKVARRFGVSHPAVSIWARRNSIPVKHAEVIALEYGIDCDWLHDPWGCSPKLTQEQTARVLAGEDPYAVERPLIDEDDMWDYSQPVNWDEEE